MPQIESLIDQELLNILEDKLSDLAAMWRGRDDPAETDEIVRQYHAILNCMIELGFRDSLDVDAELSDRLMPQVYLEMFS